eukprot:CAMPEP_0194574618 /NCGR_PEP_ID=MMETSP0292-20121207/10399_1 /TAXON_ID=39354 /ORGANISM="Heterosigma akashiwo, Strain CCMP2393" /LENGTH=653 /DNA_ID=CAMNT_0039426179 /DNA_START=314 /DNA_END=2275 /DNA_ORIENTATION=-
MKKKVAASILAFALVFTSFSTPATAAPLPLGGGVQYVGMTSRIIKKQVVKRVKKGTYVKGENGVWVKAKPAKAVADSTVAEPAAPAKKEVTPKAAKKEVPKRERERPAPTPSKAVAPTPVQTEAKAPASAPAKVEEQTSATESSLGSTVRSAIPLLAAGYLLQRFFAAKSKKLVKESKTGAPKSAGKTPAPKPTPKTSKPDAEKKDTKKESPAPPAPPAAPTNELYSAPSAPAPAPAPVPAAEEPPALATPPPPAAAEQPLPLVPPPPPAAAAEEAPPAPAPAKEEKKKKGGGFNLFKRKKEDDRPSSLEEALEVDDGPTAEFRQSAARVLAKMAPASTFPLARGAEADTQEEAVARLLAAKGSAGLADQAAAEEFACVVNAMIVQLVDEAAQTLKGKEEEATLAALDQVLDFMDSCSGVFEQLAAQPDIKPVRYNGSTGKGKLEQLYTRYAGAALMGGALLGGMVGGGGGGDGNAARLARLDRLQDALKIPNSKAEKVAQQAMSKMMQKVLAGEVDASALGLNMDDAALQEAMASLADLMPGAGGGGGGGGGAGGLPDLGALGGGGGGGLPDIDPANLDPAVLQTTMDTLKDMVNTGTTKEEIDELRKMFSGMNLDIDDLVAMSEQVGSQLGPEATEMFSLMKQILSKYPKK